MSNIVVTVVDKTASTNVKQVIEEIHYIYYLNCRTYAHADSIELSTRFLSGIK